MQPTPWYRTGLGTDRSKWTIIQSLVKDEDNYVCECDSPEDAAFIVDVVNEWHDRHSSGLTDQEYFENETP